MSFDELMTCITVAIKQYKQTMSDGRITVGELQKIFTAVSEAAIDTFGIRDKVLIDLSGK